MGKQFEWEELSVVKAQTEENLRHCQGLQSNNRQREQEKGSRGERRGEEPR